MPADTPAYVGYCGECGGMVAATVDRPEYVDQVADDVAEFIRGGMRVEHQTVGVVRAQPLEHREGCWLLAAREATR